MGDNNISEKLKALATGSNRSATARLREIFDEIEAALQSGVRRKDVHQTLTENGFSISFASFELAIYRIRKAREVGKIKTPKPEEPVSEKKRPGKAEEKPVAANVVVLSGKEVAINTDGELIRPDGIPNPAWADLQAEYRTTQRKLNRNKLKIGE